LTAYARSERRALSDLMLDVSPDAPTLCDGWAVRDLAAHLVLRERRPDAALGIVIRPLEAYTARVQRELAGRPWPSLVEQVRSGPPALLRAVDEQMNAVEMFVHHEDIRRAQANWAPRTLDPGEERALWRRIVPMTRLMRRRLPVGVTLEATGFGRVEVRPGDPHVTVKGPPGELVLFMSGRQRVARVDVSGPPDAVARLQATRLGV
jgi:uncharacterized protein (TIGR03085 family)